MVPITSLYLSRQVPLWMAVLYGQSLASQVDREEAFLCKLDALLTIVLCPQILDTKSASINVH